MKLLAIVLLVLNIVFALWAWRESEIEMPAHPAGVERLLLLSERPSPAPPPVAVSTPPPVSAPGPAPVTAAPAPPAEEPAAPEPVPPVLPAPLPPVTEASPPAQERACARIGPWTVADEAQGIVERLRAQGVQAIYVAGAPGRITGYFALMPAAATLDEARALRAELARKGVTDVFLFTSGELTGAISLGLYNREINARDRVNEVAALGFTAEVRPRTRDDGGGWIEAQAMDAEQRERVAQAVPGRVVEWRTAGCGG